MRVVSAGNQAHIALTATTLCLCFLIIRRDGTLIAGTEHDLPLAVDLGDGNGEITYQPVQGWSRSNIQSGRDFKVDSLTLSGALESAGITRDDIFARRYAGARVKVFAVNWQDLAAGAIAFGQYLPGELQVRGIEFLFNLRGLIDLYSNEIVELRTAACTLELGGAFCLVQLEPAAWPSATTVAARVTDDAQSFGGINTVTPSVFNDRQFECTAGGTTAVGEPTWNTTLGGLTVEGTGVTWIARRALTLPLTVSAVADRRNFTVGAYAGDAPDSLFKDGRVEFLDGANAGDVREVKAWSLAGKTIKLFDPAGSAIAVNDTIKLKAGCDKDLDCDAVFRNIRNRGGFNHVPSIWTIIQKP